MDPVRHLLVWLGVGAGHVALLVSLWGPGLATSDGADDSFIELVWAEPDALPVQASPANAAPAPASMAARPPMPAAAPCPVVRGDLPRARGSAGELGVERGEPPSFVDRVEPAYPRGARLAGIQGVVRLRLEVDAAGALRHAAVLVSSGDAALDRAALQAAAASTYRPARVGGRGVDALVEASYRFELR